MGEHKVHYMCKYTPAELMAGFGCACERLEPTADTFDTAESLGHPNMCGYGKGLLEAVVSRNVRELVLVNCCDVVRRIYDILKQKMEKNASGALNQEDSGLRFLYLIDLPHCTGKTEAKLLKRQLQKLIQAYEDYSGIPFRNEMFVEAWGISTGCSWCGDKTTESQRQNSPELVSEEQGPWISLQGAHSGAFLSKMIQQHMPVSVRDETCTGNRSLLAPDRTLADKEGTWDREALLDAYAQALLEQIPCMRMTDISGREKIGKGAAGIIYHTMKFCDYYGFEYAGLSGNKENPLLKIETDGTRQSEGQLATRLDAFAESLQGMTGEKNMNLENAYVAGVDSGSASTDAVILDPEGNMVGWSVVRTGSGAASGAEKALEMALDMAGITREDLGRIVSTGYGRGTIGLGNDSITEITCHARGAHYLRPSVRTVIDIGGQDSKVIRLDETGAVVNFVMNDKCAAGTGRFLEMMARTMEMSMEEMSRRGLSWKEEVQISSMCTVFAESEVVSLIARNKKPEDIIHGLNQSIAGRTAALVKRVGGESDYMMTGGVAKNRGVVEVLEKKLGQKIFVSEHAQLCGAIGAALLAREKQ